MNVTFRLQITEIDFSVLSLYLELCYSKRNVLYILSIYSKWGAAGFSDHLLSNIF